MHLLWGGGKSLRCNRIHCKQGPEVPHGLSLVSSQPGTAHLQLRPIPCQHSWSFLLQTGRCGGTAVCNACSVGLNKVHRSGCFPLLPSLVKVQRQLCSYGICRNVFLVCVRNSPILLWGATYPAGWAGGSPFSCFHSWRRIHKHMQHDILILPCSDRSK